MAASQLLPEFRPAMETYLNEVTLLSRRILHLAADALDLPAAMFDKYVCSHKKHQGVNDDMILLLHCRLIHNYLIR
jgi:isopenicillin N synthase-like dioxygenase